MTTFKADITFALLSRYIVTFFYKLRLNAVYCALMSCIMHST